MKKKILLSLLIFTTLVTLTGCGNSKSEAGNNVDSEQTPNIVDEKTEDSNNVDDSSNVEEDSSNEETTSTTTTTSTTITKQKTTTTKTTTTTSSTYKITSIKGVGNEYTNFAGTTCKVDNFTVTSIKKETNVIRVNYTYKATMVHKGNSNPCDFRFVIYDSSNEIVGGETISVYDLNNGESYSKSDYTEINVNHTSDTNFYIEFSSVTDDL